MKRPFIIVVNQDTAFLELMEELLSKVQAIIGPPKP